MHLGQVTVGRVEVLGSRYSLLPFRDATLHLLSRDRIGYIPNGGGFWQGNDLVIPYAPENRHFVGLLSENTL